MKLSEEQIQALLAAAGVLGPHMLVRAQPNNGIATDFVLAPCTTPKAYVFDVLVMARNPALGTITTTRLRMSVHGDPAAPAAVGGNIATWAAVTDMANPPTFVLAVVGVNLVLRVTNPVAGTTIDVEAIVFGPYISS